MKLGPGWDGRNSQEQPDEGSAEFRDQEKKLGDSGSGRETLQLDVKVWGPHGPVAWDPCTLGVLGSPGTGEPNRKVHFPVGTWVSWVHGIFLLWI